MDVDYGPLDKERDMFDYSDFMETAWSLAAGLEDNDEPTGAAYVDHTFAPHPDGGSVIVPTAASVYAAPAVRLAAEMLHAATVLSNLPINVDYIAHDDAGSVEDIAADWILSVHGQDVFDFETAARVLAARAREIAANIGKDATDAANLNEHRLNA